MDMKLIIFFVLLGTVTSSSSVDWLKFKHNYNKSYKSVAEENERKQIFYENVDRIRTFQRTNPNATFTVAINHLTDRRIDELVSSAKHNVQSRPRNIRSLLKSIKFPDSLDWRTKGVVSQVKNQGLLGQANAIVAVEVIETLHAIQTGNLESGSIARVVDCCPQSIDPFQCIKKLGGICSTKDYPTPIGQCKPDACKPFASFDKAMQLKNQDENDMVAWIQNSTLFVGIDASKVSFQIYQGGIYKDSSCSATLVDHTMQLVGYGKTTSGELYWICKNSWGTGWGEQGYIRVLRGYNTCGIASYVIQLS